MKPEPDRSTWPANRRRGLLIAASFLAGFAVLTLESVWIRQVGWAAGRTVVSAAWVLAAFFSAAGAGAWTGGMWVARTRQPARLCGLAFAGAGALALAGTFLTRWYPLPSLDAAFCAAALAGPPALLWGMGFPCMAELAARDPHERTARAGAFYAADLAGGAAGVVLGGLALPMAAGYHTAAAAASLLLFGAGALAWFADSGMDREPAPAPPAPSAAATSAWGVLVCLGSGFLSLAAETVALQWLLLVTNESVFSVAAVLLVFIVDLAAGAALATALRRRGSPSARLLKRALLWTGALSAATPFMLKLCLDPALPPGWARWSAGTWGTLAAALLALTPVGVSLGMVFPLAWEHALPAARHQGLALGRLAGLNKLACAAGALSAPLVLVPWLGPSRGWVAIGAGYTLLAAVRWPGLRAAAAIAVIAAGLVWAPTPVRLAPGERLLDLAYDPQAVVATVVDAEGSRHIVLNQHYTLNGTGHAILSQRHEAWLPLVLSPRCDRVLFIGMASGISAEAALDFPVKQLTAAELVPAVARAAREHFAEWNARLFADPRARIVIDDGRHVIATADGTWDVVICDLLLPWAEGTADLYSLDFFALVRDRLGPDGVFCLWMPMYQLNANVAGIVARTLTDAFPYAIVVRGNLAPGTPILGLLGSRAPFDLSRERLSRRLTAVAGQRPAIESPFLRSADHLRLALAGDLHAESWTRWPLNTDDRPAVAFAAPKALGGTDLLRGIRLLSWFSDDLPVRAFPSCDGEGVTPDALGRGVLAGHNDFAAAVMNVPLPDTSQQAQRHGRAAYHMERARSLWPAATLQPEDLGR